jgi:hypothetical protein
VARMSSKPVMKAIRRCGFMLAIVAGHSYDARLTAP